MTAKYYNNKKINVALCPFNKYIGRFHNCCRFTNDKCEGFCFYKLLILIQRECERCAKINDQEIKDYAELWRQLHRLKYKEEFYEIYNNAYINKIMKLEQIAKEKTEAINNFYKELDRKIEKMSDRQLLEEIVRRGV